MLQDKLEAAETFFEAAITFEPQSILAWTMFGLSFYLLELAYGDIPRYFRLSYLSPHLRSSGLLSARILSWLGCGRPSATCHCLSRYTREQSTCRPRAVVGGQRQSLRSSRL